MNIVSAWLMLMGTGMAGAPATPQPTLPANHQSCVVDSDCAVAPSLAGWAEEPPVGASCKAVCTVGVSRTALGAWLALVKEKATKIPCDLEMEPCPPTDHFKALCVEQKCRVKYVGAKKP